MRCPTTRSFLSLLIWSALIVSACSKPIPPPATRSVTGVVTDSVTGAPVSGATVTLLSTDRPAPQATDGGGFFIFKNVVQNTGLVVTFSAAGYAPATLSLDAVSVSVDGSTQGTEVDVVNASVALTPLAVPPPTLNVGGWVYAGDHVAKQAQVVLTKTDPTAPLGGTYFANTLAGEDGRFDFTDVPPGAYSLQVWPYDDNHDGIAEFRLYNKDLGRIGVDSTADISTLVIILQQPSVDLLASSFVGVTYPIRPSDLTTGVSAIIRDGTADLWLQWGQPVDTSVSNFELRAVDASGRQSAPLPISVTWDHNTILHIHPNDPFSASPDATHLYELRITALRYSTGATPFSPTGHTYGKITFSVQSLSTPLDNPVPELFIPGTQIGTQTAVTAAFDAAGAWLADEAGGLFGGYTSAPNWNSTTGLQLQWDPVDGAVNYKVYARNTISSGVIGENRTQWQLLHSTLNSGADPSGSGRKIIATGVGLGDFSLFGLMQNGTAFPWLFGNGMDLTVTSVDAAGFEAPIDTTKIITVKDTTGPMLDSGVMDYRGGSNGLTWQASQGASILQVLRLRFSEPILPSVDPTLHPFGNIISFQQGTTSWDLVDQGVPVQSSQEIAIPVTVRVHGSCVGILASRSIPADGETDFLFPVRDTAIIPTGKDAVVLTSSGTWWGEAQTVTPKETGLLQADQLVGFNGSFLSAGSQLCAMSGPDTVSLISASGNTVRVSDARKVTLGRSIAIVEPAICPPTGTCTAGFVTITTVVGVDTTTGNLTVSPSVFQAHTSSSAVFEWSGSTASLRPSFTLSTGADTVVPNAANNVVLWVTNASGVRVGDALLIDKDGDTRTTGDRRIVTVKSITTSDTLDDQIRVDVTSGLTVVHNVTTITDLGDGFDISGLQDTSGNQMTNRRASVSGRSSSAFVFDTIQ